MLTYHVKILYS